MVQNTVVHQIGLAGILVYLLQGLKRANWFPWIGQHTDTLNRVLSLIAAGIAAVGVEIATTGSLTTGGTLTITYPSWQVMTETGLRFVCQYVLQQAFYKQVKS